MGYYYFKCRSITYAQRASKALYGKGIYAMIVKLPLKYSDEGCGYSLKISERQFEKAYDVLIKSGFVISKILTSKDGNTFKEVLL